MIYQYTFRSTQSKQLTVSWVFEHRLMRLMRCHMSMIVSSQTSEGSSTSWKFRWGKNYNTGLGKYSESVFEHNNKVLRLLHERLARKKSKIPIWRTASPDCGFPLILLWEVLGLSLNAPDAMKVDTTMNHVPLRSGPEMKNHTLMITTSQDYLLIK